MLTAASVRGIPSRLSPLPPLTRMHATACAVVGCACCAAPPTPAHERRTCAVAECACGAGCADPSKPSGTASTANPPIFSVPGLQYTLLMSTDGCAPSACHELTARVYACCPLSPTNCCGALVGGRGQGRGRSQSRPYSYLRSHAPALLTSAVRVWCRLCAVQRELQPGRHPVSAGGFRWHKRRCHQPAARQRHLRHRVVRALRRPALPLELP
jgi:hypothetical protein